MANVLELWSEEGPGEMLTGSDAWQLSTQEGPSIR